MKKYKAIIFDWDGTAVISREAPADDVIPKMTALLEQGIILIIISGTTYENIDKGTLHERIPEKCLNHLFLGLGRGAYNYGFKNGKPVILNEKLMTKKEKIGLHEICFNIHKHLLNDYNYDTDIVFSRPNYCKIDLLPRYSREGKLYLQDGEIEKLNNNLRSHGFAGGIQKLMSLASEFGKGFTQKIQATTDAKYLEVGISTKSDNVNYFMEHVLTKRGISIEQCSFWGDEFTYLGEGISGSDAFMITEKTKGGDFFDVSKTPQRIPVSVKQVGGGVATFLKFLDNQVKV